MIDHYFTLPSVLFFCLIFPSIDIYNIQPVVRSTANGLMLFMVLLREASLDESVRLKF